MVRGLRTENSEAGPGPSPPSFSLWHEAAPSHLWATASCALRVSICLTRSRQEDEDQGQLTSFSQVAGILPAVLRVGACWGSGGGSSWGPPGFRDQLGSLWGGQRAFQNRVHLLIHGNSATKSKT